MIIKEFRKNLKKNLFKKFVLFGQNITFGSRISGLTSEIEKNKNVRIYNTQNSENSLVGFGLGLMLNNRNSIYFAKQLDFILLAMDHIVNTFNYIIFKKKIGSFSIITYIVDSGFEGPQSRLYNLQEISSMSFVDCIYLIFPEDIKINLKKINNKSFKIFCLSQRYSKTSPNPKLIRHYGNKNIFQYKEGKKGTIVSIGFASYKIYDEIKARNLDFNFYVITNPLQKISKNLIQKILNDKCLYIFEDSRSKTKNLDYLINYIKNKKPNFIIKTFFRDESIQKLNINSDKYKFKL